MKSHNLKTIQPYFDQVWSGTKTCEVRFNDRDFQVDDQLWLYEYIPDANSTGGVLTTKRMKTVVTAMLTASDFPGAIKPGWVVMSISVKRRYKK